MTPFDLFEKDVDAVIMIINYFIAKGERQSDAPTTTLNEREESAAFWAAL